MKKIVVSAVNLNLGGTLTIAKSLLAELDKRKDLSVIALVHDKNDYSDLNRVKLIQIPEIKKSWLRRIVFEYWTSKKISKRIKCQYWICAHDMSARVSNGKQYVYCHNPSPFYKDLKLTDFLFDKKFFIFCFLYKYLYGFFITRNKYVFVQQEWLAKEFQEQYHINNVVVTRPESVTSSIDTKKDNYVPKRNITIFYPSVPRVFKNFDVLLSAAKIIEDSGQNNVNFVITLSGNENKYAKCLFEKYKHLSNVSFVGFLRQDQMQTYYRQCDIVCFPSKLETWGLPISEAKEYNKPLILADLPYAHETVGEYDKVAFFSPNSPKELASLISNASRKNIFEQTSFSSNALRGWPALVDYILKD